MLDQNSYTEGADIPKIINNIKGQQTNADEFFNLVKNEKLGFSIIYEIRKC